MQHRHLNVAGFYQFDEEEEDAEARGIREHFIEVEEFVGLALNDLIDSSLTGWVHHIPYILPQVGHFPFIYLSLLNHILLPLFHTLCIIWAIVVEIHCLRCSEG